MFSLLYLVSFVSTPHNPHDPMRYVKTASMEIIQMLVLPFLLQVCIDSVLQTNAGAQSTPVEEAVSFTTSQSTFSAVL
jgi:hypothetical protein